VKDLRIEGVGRDVKLDLRTKIVVSDKGEGKTERASEDRRDKRDSNYKLYFREEYFEQIEKIKLSVLIVNVGFH
jgi:hypothetical protein